MNSISNHKINAVVPFSNKFGSLELVVVSSLMRVSDISLEKCEAVQHNTFSIDDAEKIALITGNNGIQIGAAIGNLNEAYLVLHQGSSHAYLCRVNILSFHLDGDTTPEQQIAYMAKMKSQYHRAAMM
jgi:hypothetical protein